mgnify:CR=1 FL=1|tara:strand:+ start:191 stop:1123 length:933 start_codon:yes stop_codon:yes gene_type:complete
MALTKVTGEGVGTLTSDLTIPDKIIHDGDTNTAIRFPSADTVSFETGGSERARVDSAGDVLVAKTASTSSTVGCELNAIGRAMFTRDGGLPLLLNRETDDGTIAQFRKDNTVVGIIGVNSGLFYIGQGDTTLMFTDVGNQLLPRGTDGASRDNAIDFGSSSNRLDDIFASNGTIQTSDRNDKQDIEELSDAEARVAVVAKGLMRKFRWKSAVAEKGDNARTHFGIIAQDLQDAFTAEGLDAGDYAMFISDTWWQKEITVDAVVADEANGIEAKDAYTYIDTKDEATDGYTERTRLGVRYSELLAFIISAI